MLDLETVVALITGNAPAAYMINVFRVSGDYATWVFEWGGQYHEREVRVGQRLRYGDTLITGKCTQVYLLYGRTSIYRLGESSHVTAVHHEGQLVLAMQRGKLTEVQLESVLTMHTHIGNNVSNVFVGATQVLIMHYDD